MLTVLPIVLERLLYYLSHEDADFAAYCTRTLTFENVCLLRMSVNLLAQTYSHGKRDLFTWQKGPIHMAKETYSHAKKTY